MTRNPSVSLTDHHQRVIAGLVASGRYHGVSEVVRDGLRLPEEKEERRRAALAEIEKARQEGLANGQPSPRSR